MSEPERQTAIQPQEVAAAIRELQEFIAQCPDAREVRKALALKLVYQGYLYEEIQTILRCITRFNHRLETSL